MKLTIHVHVTRRTRNVAGFLLQIGPIRAEHFNRKSDAVRAIITTINQLHISITPAKQSRAGKYSKWLTEPDNDK